MHCTEHRATRTRLSKPLAAAVLGVAGLLLLPAANAQMNQTQPRPQAQSLQTQSPSPTIPDQKLTAGCGGPGAGDQHQAEL